MIQVKWLRIINYLHGPKRLWSVALLMVFFYRHRWVLLLASDLISNVFSVLVYTVLMVGESVINTCVPITGFPNCPLIQICNTPNRNRFKKKAWDWFSPCRSWWVFWYANLELMCHVIPFLISSGFFNCFGFRRPLHWRVFEYKRRAPEPNRTSKLYKL